MSKRRDGLVAFFMLVFGYTWGLAAIYALFPGALGMVSSSLTSASRSMYSNPFLISAVSSPDLAALIIAAFLGRASIADLFRRLLHWRFSWYWCAASVVGMGALAFVARLGSHLVFGSALPQFSVGALPGIATASVLDPGPFSEELGWRGFALPRLLARWNGLTAALVLGTIWVVWHLPAFFMPGMGQNQIPFWPFLITNISVTVLMTWIVNKAHGSILPAILIHWSINRFNDLQYPTAMMTAFVIAAAALIVVAMAGADLGTRREAAIDARSGI